MSWLINALKSLLHRADLRLSGDDVYLSQSVDICDLERRMRALDDGRRSALSGIAFGLYPR